MIVFVSTHRHRYTHRAVARLPGAPRISRRSYWPLFHNRSVARATYVLTDFDRLGPWELELAARMYRLLTQAGLRVLNDPAQHLGRHAMLRRFHDRGINRFNVWSPSLDERPERFPVFLRTQSAHRGPLTGLLTDAEAAEAALTEALAAGYPLTELVFIEYAAAPAENGVFQKRAVFRIGDRLVPGPTVNSRDWVAKAGENGVAGEALYSIERAELETLPFAEPLMAAFEAADMDYGRADYAVLDGAPQIYEINSNPLIGAPTEHPFAVREQSMRVSAEQYTAALSAIDAPGESGRVRLDDPVFARQRRSDARWLWQRHRMP